MHAPIKNGLTKLKEAEMKTKRSIKTTIAGVLTGVIILATQVLNLINGEPVSIEAVAAGLGAIGIGIFARDNNVTSEDAGAK